MSQGHGGRGRPRNTWKRDLEREMWTAGFRFSWKKIETAAQDRELGGNEWTVAYDTLGVTRHKAQTEKCYSGCHKATEEEDDRETLGKKIWRGKCGQRASGSAGGRWRRQHKTELGSDECSVAYDTLGGLTVWRRPRQA